MTTSPTVSRERQMETYLNPDTLPYPFCPGCSHGPVLDRLNDALVELQLDPRRVVMVSDIGCVGLSDKYFATHAFHGLHGRSVTYATGIKLANPELKPIVLVGDGGFGIGGHHFLNAARRNIGVTVVVFNNLNFGMTGGQYSVTTPQGAVTSTTPQGHVERPLDISGTVALNGAGFVTRTTIFDDELTDIMAEAIAYDGFSLIEIWELCVAYYAVNNDLRRRTLETTMKQLGYDPGVLQREERPEYTRSYREANREKNCAGGARHQRFPAQFASSLDRRERVMLAGAAGQYVRSAARLLATGGVLSGLWTTSRGDYPVTVRSGFSVSEVILSPRPIHYTGIEHPDTVALLAPEGKRHVERALAAMEPSGTVYAIDGLGPVETPAEVRPVTFPSASRRQQRQSLSTLAVAKLVQDLDLYPLDALREAVARTQRSTIAEQNLAAIDAATS